MFSEEEISDAELSKLPHDIMAKIQTPHELDLIKGLTNWSKVVESAAAAMEPHRIAFYLVEIAGLFHSLWNSGNSDAKLRFIVPEDKPLTLARLALIKAVMIVLQSGLSIVGCKPVEELRSTTFDA